MLSEQEKEYCQQLRKLMEALEKSKLLYREFDRVEALIEHCSPIDLANEGILKSDNFAKKNTQWKNTAFKRWAYTLLNLNEEK